MWKFLAIARTSEAGLESFSNFKVRQMPDTARQPVKFERPPIVEVVCGVSFDLPKPLTSAYVGLFWSRIKQEYPNTLDQPPAAAMVEGPGLGSGVVEFQIVSLPPLRRAFFSSPDGRHLIQLQDDRFLLNWKKMEDADHYPSYANVIKKFREQYAVFTEFLEDVGLGAPRVTQLELTYVNIMDIAPDSPPNSTLLVDHQLGPGERFLPKAEAINWQTSYALPDQNGRLHTVAQSARNVKKSGVPVLRLDLTARGMPRGRDPKSCEAWFDLAHDWITYGFADITSHAAQKSLWRRTS